MRQFLHLKKEGRSEIWGIILFTFALLVLLSLLSFGKVSYVGLFGKFLAKFLLYYLGWGSYFLPLLVFLGGLNFFKSEKVEKIPLMLVGTLFFLIGGCSLLSCFNPSKMGGGELGKYFSELLIKGFGYVGTYLILISILVISIILTTGFSLNTFLNKQVLKFLNCFITKFKKLLLFSLYKVKKKSHNYKGKIKIEPPLLSTKAPSYKLREENLPRDNKQKHSLNKEKGEVLKDASLNLQDSTEEQVEYKLPPLELLDTPLEMKMTHREEDLKERALLLEKTLSNFDIRAKVVQISPGPVITRYEIEPAPGVKVNRIINLSSDIALAMKSGNVRILAPIPDKAAIGIEIPNRKVSAVGLKEILMTDEFRKASSKLSIGLGKTVAGFPYIADLSCMPHLLIAGATGSGKSICLKVIITSILYKAKPDEVKFVLIDPKRLEMLFYDNIPHLCVPVICRSNQTSSILQNLIRVMEERYEKFAKKMVRDIESYNKLMANQSISGGKDKECYLVVIIDELADLMMVASREVEEAIIRLSQMGRAVGIHLILATQRPSVDVITGVIKANLPSRIAFQVLSKTDSRVILDVNGAEDLLGKGDLLFLPSGASKPVRLQGAFVSERESRKIVEFIKKYKEPRYNFHLLQQTSRKEIEKEKKDPLFDEAVRLIFNTGQASTSFLQRRLGIGYIRAAKLIDTMEQEGIISSLMNGTKSREILIEREDYNERQERL